MKTILNSLLLQYANTLEIEYLGRRRAKIKFLNWCNLKKLERLLKNDSRILNISDFNCNGIWTTAVISIPSFCEPFY